jgi:hypothetical protein
MNGSDQQCKPSIRLSDLFTLSYNFVAGDDNAAHDIQDMNAYMSTVDVQYYVDLFFVYVHPRWPFLYRESFRAESEQPVIVLAVVMFGLWITEEARLMKLAWMIHARLRNIFKTQMVCPSSFFFSFSIHLIYALLYGRKTGLCTLPPARERVAGPWSPTRRSSSSLSSL